VLGRTCKVFLCGVYVVCSVVSSSGLDDTFGRVGGYLCSRCCER